MTKKKLEQTEGKNIKEENCRKKTNTHFKLYITNVKLKTQIFIKVFVQTFWLFQQFMVLEDSFIYLFFKCFPIYS